MHNQDWPMAFFLCGGLIFFMGCVTLFLLHPHPNDVGLLSPNELSLDTATTVQKHPAGDTEMEQPLVPAAPNSDHQKRGGLLTALLIPGVIPFALALLFAKLVAYAFLYFLCVSCLLCSCRRWARFSCVSVCLCVCVCVCPVTFRSPAVLSLCRPLYLTHLDFSTAEAGQLSTFFDLGGIVGGIVAGYSSDKLKMPGLVSVLFLLAAIPTMFMYRSVTRSIGDSSVSENIGLMLFTGAIVNGPYALITTAISADLGTHKSLQGQATLMATVTAIIDGTGSIGAAIQGVLVGWLAATYSWNGSYRGGLRIGCAHWVCALGVRIGCAHLMAR